MHANKGCLKNALRFQYKFERILGNKLGAHILCARQGLVYDIHPYWKKAETIDFIWNFMFRKVVNEMLNQVKKIRCPGGNVQ